MGNNWDKVSFGTTSIVISSGGSSEGESSYTNPVNRMDVNGDSFVSPIDVLWVVNVTNTRGSGKLPSLTTAQGEGELTSARVRRPSASSTSMATAISHPPTRCMSSTILNSQSPAGKAAEGESAAAVELEALPSGVSQYAGLSNATTGAASPLSSASAGTRTTTVVAESAAASTLAYHTADDTDAAIADWAARNEAADSDVADDLAEEISRLWSGLISRR